VLGAVDNVLMFFIAVIVGSFVTAFLVNILKKTVEPEPALAADGPAGAAEDENTSNKTEEAAGVSADEHSEIMIDEAQEINQLTDILDINLINTNLSGNTRDEVIDECVQTLNKQGVLETPEILNHTILDLQIESTNNINMNISIFDGISTVVKKTAVTCGIRAEGVDWYSIDGTDAIIVCMIAVSEESSGDVHLKMLQMLTRNVMDED